MMRAMHGREVRELENVIHRSFALRGRLSQPRHLSEGHERTDRAAGGTLRQRNGTQIDTGNAGPDQRNRTHAAKLLGISLRTLRNKLREYRVEEEVTV
jgi:DNA-binding NtrC family response regulator